MKYLLIGLLVFYLLYRLSKMIFRIFESGGNSSQTFKNNPPSTKYKNVEEAEYTEIKSEKKLND